MGRQKACGSVLISLASSHNNLVLPMWLQFPIQAKSKIDLPKLLGKIQQEKRLLGEQWRSQKSENHTRRFHNTCYVNSIF